MARLTWKHSPSEPLTASVRLLGYGLLVESPISFPPDAVALSLPVYGVPARNESHSVPAGTAGSAPLILRARASPRPLGLGLVGGIETADRRIVLGPLVTFWGSPAGA